MRAMILPTGSSHCSFSAEEGKQVQILREHVAVKRFFVLSARMPQSGKSHWAICLRRLAALR